MLEFDGARITKPARCSTNVPWAGDAAAPQLPEPRKRARTRTRVASAFPSKAAKLMVVSAAGGAPAAAALAALRGAGYEGAVELEGGYAAYDTVWSPSGKRRPPAGRWVSTGKEALKSGLNIPGVAEAYDEGGNLVAARYAEGLRDGQDLPPMS
ncbi:MAG: hypothetical protein J3K34DRAFT_527834 [Monoraphidium minutum]|nr:MAG: hypothetical protein J3K34DRAFT_527834 [Monoraphidium minutum]